MVRALHAAGLEVILDVVYNHTAEGNHLGPTLSLRGIDNSSYYRLLPNNPRYYQDFTGMRQHAEHAQPARAAAHHGQPALLGPRDARRRVPLRPGERAGSRVARRRQARRVLRHHSSGSRAVAGQAHRRAVGSRRRRVSGRQLSRRSGRSGTASTGTRCAASGAATTARCRSWRRDCRAAAISTSRADGGRTRASTSSPRTTASRCADLVSYNEKHNEANGEHNQDGENHNLSWNCGVEGPDRRSPHPRAARSAAPQSHGDAAALASACR